LPPKLCGDRIEWCRFAGAVGNDKSDDLAAGKRWRYSASVLILRLDADIL
jgi:hypothetical protein